MSFGHGMPVARAAFARNSRTLAQQTGMPKIGIFAGTVSTAARRW